MGIPVFATAGAQSVSASATTITPVLPGSRVTNNFLFAFIQVQAASKTISISGAGWSAAVDINTTNGSSAIWVWRLVDGTETAPVFSWTGSAACSAQVQQYSGNAVVTPVGNHNQASGTATPLTAAAITSTSDNSLIIYLLQISTSQTIPSPSGYSTGGFISADGSFLACSGSLGISGSTCIPVSVAVSAGNWNSFGFELKGTGVGVASQERASQVVQTSIESYTNPAVVHVSQVVQDTMESYSTPVMNVRSSQVVFTVLRTVADAPPVSGSFIPKRKKALAVRRAVRNKYYEDRRVKRLPMWPMWLGY